MVNVLKIPQLYYLISLIFRFIKQGIVVQVNFT